MASPERRRPSWPGSASWWRASVAVPYRRRRRRSRGDPGLRPRRQRQRDRGRGEPPATLEGHLQRRVGAAVTRLSGPIDVHVVTHEEAGGRGDRLPTRAEALGGRRRLVGWVLAVLGPVALTIILTVLVGDHALSTDLMLFVALTVGVALIGGLWPALTVAVLEAFCSTTTSRRQCTPGRSRTRRTRWPPRVRPGRRWRCLDRRHCRPSDSPGSAQSGRVGDVERPGRQRSPRTGHGCRCSGTAARNLRDVLSTLLERDDEPHHGSRCASGAAPCGSRRKRTSR